MRTGFDIVPLKLSGQVQGDAVQPDTESSHGYLASVDIWFVVDTGSFPLACVRAVSLGGGSITARSARPITSALRRTLNVSSTLFLAFTRKRSLSSSECSISLIARARAAGFCGGTSRPDTRLVTSSGVPQTGVLMSGGPQAAAPMRTCGIPWG